jgi:hypothetical protein
MSFLHHLILLDFQLRLPENPLVDAVDEQLLVGVIGLYTVGHICLVFPLGLLVVVG